MHVEVRETPYVVKKLNKRNTSPGFVEMILRGAKRRSRWKICPRSRWKICPSATSSTTKPTSNGPVWKPWPLWWEADENHVRCGMEIRVVQISVLHCILPENARLPRNIQGYFTCRKSTTWDKRLCFISEGRRAEDFFRPEKSDGFGRVWTSELGYQRPARYL